MEQKTKFYVNKEYVYAREWYRHDPDIIDVIMKYKFGEFWDAFCDFPPESVTPYTFRDWKVSEPKKQLDKIYVKMPQKWRPPK